MSDEKIDHAACKSEFDLAMERIKSTFFGFVAGVVLTVSVIEIWKELGL